MSVRPHPSKQTALSSAALRVRELPLLVLLIVLVAFFSWRAPGFFNSVNLASIGRDIAVIGILGIGLTVVIITGGIDLSVASILAFSASVMALLMQAMAARHYPALLVVLLPVLAALATAALLGAGNALLITRLNVTPIVATLATLSLYRMQAMRMVTLIGPLPAGFGALGSGWGAFLIFLALLAVGMLLLGRTPWGRHVYAVGGNAAATRLSGVNVSRTIAWTYIASGIAAGVAGLVASATLNSVQGNMFMGYELDAIAAVVIGGTSIMGGAGGVLGTAIGAGIMAVLRNGLIVAGLDVYWYQAIIGIAILLVAGLDWVASRARRKRDGNA